MAPVVNGLEERYGVQIDFRWMDVNSAEGGEAFRYHQLLGHPGYVLLNPEGQVLWTGLGEQSKETLEEQLLTALNDL